MHADVCPHKATNKYTFYLREHDSSQETRVFLRGGPPRFSPLLRRLSLFLSLSFRRSSSFHSCARSGNVSAFGARAACLRGLAPHRPPSPKQRVARAPPPTLRWSGERAMRSRDTGMWTNGGLNELMFVSFVFTGQLASRARDRCTLKWSDPELLLRTRI